MAKRKVWNTKTKAFQYVPEHWLNHPVLGRDFTEKPPVKSGPTKEVKKDA